MRSRLTWGAGVVVVLVVVLMVITIMIYNLEVARLDNKKMEQDLYIRRGDMY
jgi:hypothetical protein